jgi:hypothetical protein
MCSCAHAKRHAILPRHATPCCALLVGLSQVSGWLFPFFFLHGANVCAAAVAETVWPTIGLRCTGTIILPRLLTLIKPRGAACGPTHQTCQHQSV